MNTIILLTSAVVDTVLLVGTILQLTQNVSPRQPGELMRLLEPKVTAFMGALLIAMGYFILIMKYLNPTIAGNDQVSYIYVGGFSLICVGFGCGIMFYTFLKKVIVTEDRLIFVDMFGKRKEMYWKEITQVKVPTLTNNLTLIGREARYTVKGEPKAYKEFLKIAKEKIRKEIGSDTLENLLNRSLF